MAASSPCYHCGLPVSDPQRWTLLLQQQTKSFCCPACQAVASAIITGGFEHYYQYRTELADKATEVFDKTSAPKIEQQYEIFNDEQVQHGFVLEIEPGLREAQLLIAGIHCAACCWLIEQALKKVAGLESVSVNLGTHKARIRWRADAVRFSQLLQAIHQVGYVPTPYQPDTEQALLEASGRQQLMRVGVAGIVMMQAMMVSFALYGGAFTGIEPFHRLALQWFGMVLMFPLIFYAAVPFFQGAWRSVRNKSLGMDVPVSIAILSAFAASAITVWMGENNLHREVYFDSISMFTFFLLLARYAEFRVRATFFYNGAQSILPPACLCWSDSHQAYQTLSVHSIKVGDRLCIKAGDTIPLDARVIEGKGAVNECAFSGEQKPVDKKVGDLLLAGTVNGDGVLIAEVAQGYGHTRLDTISRLADQSQANKSSLLMAVDQFAKVFTAFVLLMAVCAAFYWHLQGNPNTFAIVLSVLVVSCPCALSLATPAALSFCLLALKKRGVLIRNSACLDALKKIDTVVFDKTGTLTEGRLSISRVQVAAVVSAQRSLELAAALESFSEHPIASAFKPVATDILCKQVEIVRGMGVKGVFENRGYRLGSEVFCRAGLLDAKIPLPFSDKDAAGAGDDLHTDIAPSIAQQKIYLADGEQWLACFVVQDLLREDAKTTVTALQQLGMNVQLLSGDGSGAAEQVAKQLNMDACVAGLSPEQKLAQMEGLQMAAHNVLMVGDGINDVPVLAQADVSVAMNNASDLAKVQADAVLLTQSLSPLLDLFQHSHRTRTVIKQNLFWALLYNGLSLPLAALGFVPPWLAALGMSSSSLLVTFNSLRLHAIQKPKGR